MQLKFPFWAGGGGGGCTWEVNSILKQLPLKKKPSYIPEMNMSHVAIPLNLYTGADPGIFKSGGGGRAILQFSGVHIKKIENLPKNRRPSYIVY